MKSTANQRIVYLLEAERRKFDVKDYTPPPRLIQRCKTAFRLLKSDISKQPRQTRQRNANAQDNLAAIFEKSADIFVLRSLTSTISQLGSKRDYGLVPVLVEWWTGVRHPQNLSNISRDLCAEFGLQYLDDTKTSKTTYQDARVPEVSASDGLDLVTTRRDPNDNNVFHEGGNPDDSSRQGLPTPCQQPFGMTSFLGSEYGNQRMPDQYHAELGQRDENPLQVTTPRSQFLQNPFGKYTREIDASLPGRHTRTLYDQLSRTQASTLAQLRTGHNQLNQYLCRIGQAADKTCKCTEGHETVQHFLFECK